MTELYVVYFSEVVAVAADWWREWGLLAMLFTLGCFWTIFCRRDVP